MKVCWVFFNCCVLYYKARKYFMYLTAQMVKNLPAMQKIRVQSLGWKDPLEKGMATTLVFLPREFHRQRSLASYGPWSQRVRPNQTTSTFTLCTLSPIYTLNWLR